MAERNGNLVTIREYFVPMEAEWARNVLAQAGICCLVPDGNLNLSVPGTPVRLQVPAAAAEEAEAVLTEMEMHRRPLDEEGVQEDEAAEFEPGARDDEAEPDAVSAIDPHDLCPLPPSASLRCPACQSEAVEASEPPAGVKETFFEHLLSAATGKGWLRCAACGHTWEG